MQTKKFILLSNQINRLMRKLLLLLIVLGSFVSYSQDKDQLTEKEKAKRQRNLDAVNPFHKFGYKAKVATLSKGKYLEMFITDSIVQIASFHYNILTHKVTGFTQLDTLHSEATLKPDVVSRWINPDPLSEEFPHTSPYVFSVNNPVYFNDPSGMAPTDWFKDENDNIVYDKNVKSQDDLDKAGVKGEYIAESFTGVNQDGVRFSFDKEGKVTNTGLKQDRVDKTVEKLNDIGVDVKATPTLDIQTTEVESNVKEGATAVLGAITLESGTPDPSDVVPMKWVVTAAAAMTAGAILSTVDTDYVITTLESAVNSFASEHTSNKRKSTWNKHTNTRSGQTRGQGRNAKRGNRNKKYQKKQNPNKR